MPARCIVCQNVRTSRASGAGSHRISCVPFCTVGTRCNLAAALRGVQPQSFLAAGGMPVEALSSSFALFIGADSLQLLLDRDRRERAMSYRNLFGVIALSVALWAPTASAQLFDYGKYPDLRGQWVRWGPSGEDLKGPLVRLGPTGRFRTRFDPHKPPGLGQDVPFTPEYQ